MSNTLTRRPLDSAAVHIPVGQVYVISARCKGCRFCIELCPQEVLAESEGMNAKGYHYPVVSRNGECVHCNLCEMICPDFAIFSLPLDEQEGNETSADPAP